MQRRDAGKHRTGSKIESVAPAKGGGDGYRTYSFAIMCSQSAWRGAFLVRFHSSSISGATRSEEHTSELQSLMRTSYAVFCLKKKDMNNHFVERTQTY